MDLDGSNYINLKSKINSKFYNLSCMTYCFISTPTQSKKIHTVKSISQSFNRKPELGLHVDVFTRTFLFLAVELVWLGVYRTSEGLLYMQPLSQSIMPCYYA